jgi:predicted TPR repeat methyltransferase
LGSELFNKGETDRAIEAYRNALASVPEDAYWHEHLGIALEKKGDHEAAVSEYRTATELSPLDSGLQARYEKLLGLSQGTPGTGIAETKKDSAATEVQNSDKRVTQIMHGLKVELASESAS